MIKVTSHFQFESGEYLFIGPLQVLDPRLMFKQQDEPLLAKWSYERFRNYSPFLKQEEKGSVV